MSYLNAPATKMLATHCCICSLALMDAKSVELGIGPDCRKKYGFNLECSEAVRKMANEIVHTIACEPTHPQLGGMLDTLRNLGFTQLVGIIAKKRIKIRIAQMDGLLGDRLTVASPYDPKFVCWIKAIVGKKPIYNANGKFASWSVPASAKAQLWEALEACYPGQPAIFDETIFTVGLKGADGSMFAKIAEYAASPQPELSGPTPIDGGGF